MPIGALAQSPPPLATLTTSGACPRIPPPHVSGKNLERELRERRVGGMQARVETEGGGRRYVLRAIIHKQRLAGLQAGVVQHVSIYLRLRLAQVQFVRQIGFFEVLQERLVAGEAVLEVLFHTADVQRVRVAEQEDAVAGAEGFEQRQVGLRKRQQHCVPGVGQGLVRRGGRVGRAERSPEAAEQRAVVYLAEFVGEDVGLQSRDEGGHRLFALALIGCTRSRRPRCFAPTYAALPKCGFTACRPPARCYARFARCCGRLAARYGGESR